eukprot:201395_1
MSSSASSASKKSIATASAATFKKQSQDAVKSMMGTMNSSKAQLTDDFDGLSNWLQERENVRLSSLYQEELAKEVFPKIESLSVYLSEAYKSLKTNEGALTEEKDQVCNAYNAVVQDMAS